jgi:tRNA-2-methylthio-N6-dimethylallyladenosine synthase
MVVSKYVVLGCGSATTPAKICSTEAPPTSTHHHPSFNHTEQSRPRESVIREIEELARTGYREITLLGQNIDAYGRDLTPKQKFSDLLLAVGKVKGIERVRFVTSHPRYMSMGVIDAVASTPNMCEMFHLPVQAGDDEILRRMSRGYTVAKYLEIVDRIRTLLPDAAVTSDIIVGFPGETEEQFQNTLRLMETVKFDQVNTAAYSPRYVFLVVVVILSWAVRAFEPCFFCARS